MSQNKTTSFTELTLQGIWIGDAREFVEKCIVAASLVVREAFGVATVRLKPKDFQYRPARLLFGLLQDSGDFVWLDSKWEQFLGVATRHIRTCFHDYHEFAAWLPRTYGFWFNPCCLTILHS